ncbi:hypothetical protein [Lusitaniella coriacea]|uniref:hypothetical protein n=1 Tax=Lusitaniella coriacea TaxID=1983105 RepID=UPI003CFAD26F
MTEPKLVAPPNILGSEREAGVSAHFALELRLDPELAAFIPPLDPSDRAGLEASLLAEGCRDPLVVWAETDLLIDGYNRYEICRVHRIPFRAIELSFADREAVKRWMIANQLARRNLSPKRVSYLRGKQYLLEKRQGKRNDLTSGQFDQKLATAQRLAEDYGVSEKTIRRESKWAADVDEISAVLGSAVRTQLLSRRAKLTAADARELAKVARRSKADAQALWVALTDRFRPSKPRKPRREGANYKPGEGCEYYARLSQETWQRLNRYAEDAGAATLDGAIARLLDRAQQTVPDLG